jgi:hypothetical protein
METEFVSKERFLSEVERILQSNVMHTSEVSRRLLKFLAEKSLSGEADHLKEYTVAIDALDRPTTYDPRHDSTVRIQMGRLRQKLGEYYRTEGKDSQTVVDLPKGRFKLTCVVRTSSPIALGSFNRGTLSPTFVWVIGSVLMCLLVTTTLFALRSGFGGTASRSGFASKDWNRDLEELWGPILSGDRPLIIAVEDPLFMSLHSDGTLFCRDASLNGWDEVERSPTVLKVRRALDNPDTAPIRLYAPFGLVNTSFLFGTIFGARGRNVSMIRTSEISQQQVADSNVVFAGLQGRFQAQLATLPIQPQLTLSSTGVNDSRPHQGQPTDYWDPDGNPTDGEVYSLVSHLPGPLARGDLWIFTSRTAIGYMAAVERFTDPVLAHDLVSQVRMTTHQTPRYYQMLFKVKYKDQVPTESDLILFRELGLSGLGVTKEQSISRP